MKYTLTYTGKEINTAIGNALNLQEALQDKQDKLTAGDGIQIKEDGTITATVVDKKYIDNNFVKNLGAAADYRVYMASPEGTNTYKSASSSAVPDTIPLRNNSGQIALPNQLIEAPGVNQAISKAYGDTKYLKAGTDINLEKNLEIDGTTKLNGGLNPIHTYTIVDAEGTTHVLEVLFEKNSIDVGNNFYNGIGYFDSMLGYFTYYLNNGSVNNVGFISFFDGNKYIETAIIDSNKEYETYDFFLDESYQTQLFTHRLTLTAGANTYVLMYDCTNSISANSVQDLRTIMNISSTSDSVILPVVNPADLSTAGLQITTSLCKIGTANVTSVTDKVTTL